MSGYLKVWKEQAEKEGDDNTVALIESLIREKSRSAEWMAAVKSANETLSSMRSLVDSYEQQLEMAETLLSKMDSSALAFENISNAALLARQLINAPDRETILKIHGKLDAELAAAYSCPIQSTMLKRSELKLTSRQIPLPLDMEDSNV